MSAEDLRRAQAWAAALKRNPAVRLSLSVSEVRGIVSEFAGHDIEGHERDPTGALLSLHDYANDAERWLEATKP